MKQFYRESLIRPQFLPVLDCWEAEPGCRRMGVSNLLQDEEYLAAQLADYQGVQGSAEASLEESIEAGENSEKFAQLTLGARRRAVLRRSHDVVPLGVVTPCCSWAPVS